MAVLRPIGKPQYGERPTPIATAPLTYVIPGFGCVIDRPMLEFFEPTGGWSGAGAGSDG